MPCNEKQEVNERKGTLTDHILLVLYATAVIDEAAKISWKSTSEEGFYLLDESTDQTASRNILCFDVREKAEEERATVCHDEWHRSIDVDSKSEHASHYS